VKEELPDHDAVVRQVLLELPDVPEALLPDVLGDELGRKLLPLQEVRVDADRERLLVVAAV
jgi:hypothetical protein